MILIFSVLILILILICINLSIFFKPKSRLKTKLHLKRLVSGGNPINNGKTQNLGIPQFGNTCWLNSCIQLLNSLPDFKQFLKEIINHENIKLIDLDAVNLFKSMNVLFDQINLITNNEKKVELAMGFFYSSFNKIFSYCFTSRQQHDSEEFFTYFLPFLYENYLILNGINSGLHSSYYIKNPLYFIGQDILKIKIIFNDLTTASVLTKSNNGRKQIEKMLILKSDEIIWDNKDNKIINLAKTIKNIDNLEEIDYNGYITKMDDSFNKPYSTKNYTTLGQNTIISTSDQINFAEQEIIKKFPNFDNSKLLDGKVFLRKKKIFYSMLPDNLLIKINRLEKNNVKNNYHTNINVQFEYCGNTYQLCSYIIHGGGGNGGHYICYVLDGDKINVYNDDRVYSYNSGIINSDTVLENQNAYIIAYKKISSSTLLIDDEAVNLLIDDESVNLLIDAQIAQTAQIDLQTFFDEPTYTSPINGNEYFIDYNKEVRAFIMKKDIIHIGMPNKYAIPLSEARKILKPIIDEKVKRLTNNFFTNSLLNSILEFFNKKFIPENGHSIYEYVDLLDIDYKNFIALIRTGVVDSEICDAIDEELVIQIGENVKMLNLLKNWKDDRIAYFSDMFDNDKPRFNSLNSVEQNNSFSDFSGFNGFSGFSGNFSGSKKSKKKNRKKKKPKKKKPKKKKPKKKKRN